jgi:hypothetical protein
VQKSESLTTFSQSDCNNTIYLFINDLSPAMHGQCIPAKSGQGNWLFHLEVTNCDIKFITLIIVFRFLKSTHLQVLTNPIHLPS